jgi:hypothetical protein
MIYFNTLLICQPYPCVLRLCQGLFDGGDGIKVFAYVFWSWNIAIFQREAPASMLFVSFLHLPYVYRQATHSVLTKAFELLNVLCHFFNHAIA